MLCGLMVLFWSMFIGEDNQQIFKKMFWENSHVAVNHVVYRLDKYINHLEISEVL